jgi:pilus assembly protein Flp/PilA
LRSGKYRYDRIRPPAEEGATAVEYALMAGLIAMVIIIAVAFLGRATGDAMCGPVGGLGGSVQDCLDGS